MKNENEKNETVELQKTELENLAFTLPVRTKLRAGRAAACCNGCSSCQA